MPQMSEAPSAGEDSETSTVTDTDQTSEAASGEEDRAAVMPFGEGFGAQTKNSGAGQRPADAMVPRRIMASASSAICRSVSWQFRFTQARIMPAQPNTTKLYR